MRVRVRLGYANRADVVLDAGFTGERAEVAGAAGLPAPDYVWPNDDDQGYGLFLPDARTTAWIGAHVGEVLTAPFLRRTLDRLEWIRASRRIFFLPAWVDAFVGGQVSSGAVSVVDDFLAARQGLPVDVRRKLLVARDELDLTVRIRAAANSGGPGD